MNLSELIELLPNANVTIEYNKQIYIDKVGDILVGVQNENNIYYEMCINDNKVLYICPVHTHELFIKVGKN